mgnify:CR=1 FL=1
MTKFRQIRKNFFISSFVTEFLISSINKLMLKYNYLFNPNLFIILYLDDQNILGEIA